MVRTAWDKFIRSFQWSAGEYVTIYGPKGYGKTTVLLELAKRRKYVVILANKVRDRTLETFIKANNFTEIDSWPKRPVNKYKIVLWPRFEGKHSFQEQHDIFDAAINGTRKEPGIFRQGGWTVAFDEMLYLTGRDGIGLDQEVRMMYTQGRSNDLSIVGGSQRPFDVPKYMSNQADHFFYFQYSDRDELDRLAGVTGNLSKEVREIVPNLKKYEFMYINRETRSYTVSKVEK